MTIKPDPRLVLSEVARNIGPVPGISAAAAVAVLIFAVANATHPSRTLAFALVGVVVGLGLYLATGILIVVNARIRVTRGQIEYRDMFRRTRVCPEADVTTLALRRISLMNSDQGVLLFLGSDGTCLLAGFGAYWPMNQFTQWDKTTRPRLDTGWATIPRSDLVLSPASSVPTSLRSPQTVQAILGGGLVDRNS